MIMILRILYIFFPSLQAICLFCTTFDWIITYHFHLSWSLCWWHHSRGKMVLDQQTERWESRRMSSWRCYCWESCPCWPSPSPGDETGPRWRGRKISSQSSAPQTHSAQRSQRSEGWDRRPGSWESWEWVCSDKPGTSGSLTSSLIIKPFHLA